MLPEPHELRTIPATFDDAHRVRTNARHNDGRHPARSRGLVQGDVCTHLVEEAIARLLAEDAFLRPDEEVATALWLTYGVDHVDAERARMRCVDHPVAWIRALAATLTHGGGAARSFVPGAADGAEIPERSSPSLDAWYALTSPHPEVRALALRNLGPSSLAIVMRSALRDPVLARCLSRARNLPTTAALAVVESIESGIHPPCVGLGLARAAIGPWHDQEHRPDSPSDGWLRQLATTKCLEDLLSAEAERWGMTLDAVRPGGTFSSPEARMSSCAIQLRLLRAAAAWSPACVEELLPHGDLLQAELSGDRPLRRRRANVRRVPRADASRVWSPSLVVAAIFHIREGSPCTPRTLARVAARAPGVWTLPAIPVERRIDALRTLASSPDLPPLTRDAFERIVSDDEFRDEVARRTCPTDPSHIEARWALIELALRALPAHEHVAALAEALPCEQLDELLLHAHRALRLAVLGHDFACRGRRDLVVRRFVATLPDERTRVEDLLPLAHQLPPDALPTLWSERLREAYWADLAAGERTAGHTPLSRRKMAFLTRQVRDRIEASQATLVGVLRALAAVRPGTCGPAMLALLELAARSPAALRDGLATLPTDVAGAWADHLLYSGAFPRDFEQLVAPVFAALDEPRARRYALAVTRPESVFVTESVRAEMREHASYAAACRPPRRGSSRARPSFTPWFRAPEARLGGPQRRLDPARYERLERALVAVTDPHASFTNPRKRKRRPVFRPIWKTRKDRHMHPSLVARRATSPDAERIEALLACAARDPVGASRMAAYELRSSVQWGIWLRSRRGGGPADGRAVLLDQLIDLAAPNVPADGWPGLFNALHACSPQPRRDTRHGRMLAGLHSLATQSDADAALPTPLLRLVERMPWEALPSVLRWMRLLPSSTSLDPAVRDALLERLRAFPDDRLHPHRAVLRAWAGETRDPVLRDALARRLAQGPERERTLGELARVWQWTQHRAKELLGRTVQIEFLADPRLGYANPQRDVVAVNVLPLLQGQPGGRALVEALILHELGHLLWHAAPPFRAAWATACHQGIEGHLNVVLDEQLERRFRRLRPAWGEQLHALTAWVFGHGRRLVSIDQVWHTLGEHALSSAARRWLSDPDRQGPTSALVRASADELRTLARLSGAHRGADGYGAFLRHLRMGLGARNSGERVRRSLAAIDRSVVHDSADSALERAKRLEAIWSPPDDPWGRGRLPDVDCGVDGEATGAAAASPWGEGGSALGGITATEVEVWIHRTTTSASDPTDAAHAASGRLVNVSNDLAVNGLRPVDAAPPDPRLEAALLDAARPRGRALAQAMLRLGARRVPRGRQLVGARIDTNDLVGRLLRDDPRLLRRPVVERSPDFFLGMCIDCSGSMRMFERMKRAQRMAAVLWTAANDLPGSECDVVGFNSEELLQTVVASKTRFTSLQATGGNNDAAALRAMCERAVAARATRRLVVMISDGSPSHCSVDALRAEVRRWSGEGVTLAQLCLRSDPDDTFPATIVVDDHDEAGSLDRFQRFVEQLARQAAA